MKHTVFSSNFRFRRFQANKCRYTDARGGADMHYVAFMRKGNCRIVSREITLLIPEGAMFYIPAGLAYQSYWHGDDEIEFDSFGFLDFPETMHGSFALQLLPQDPQIRTLVDRIADNPQVCSATLGDFYTLLGLLIPHMAFREKEGSYSQILRDASAYLTQHPRASITEVAKRCNVSESGLYNAFRQNGGMTPNELRHQILVDKAVRLLQTTDLSVEQISRQLEFSSTSYFRKIVVSVTGKTPQQLRKTVGGI